MEINEHIEKGDFVHLESENLTGMVYDIRQDQLKVKFSNGELKWKSKSELQKINDLT